MNDLHEIIPEGPDSRTEPEPTTGKYCGSKHCTSSTGICGSNTHGFGEPDQHGYFDLPCFVCARHYEKLHPEEGKHWPFPKLIVEAEKPKPPVDQKGSEVFQTEEAIKDTLMDYGVLWVGEVYDKVAQKLDHIKMIPFDIAFCNLIGYGKLHLIHWDMDGLTVSVTPRTRLPLEGYRFKP